MMAVGWLVPVAGCGTAADRGKNQDLDRPKAATTQK